MEETTLSLLLPYWRPLLGTAGCWCLYDIVEYGLKQNDAAIFDAGLDAPYSQCLGDPWATLGPQYIEAPWVAGGVSHINFLG